MRLTTGWPSKTVDNQTIPSLPASTLYTLYSHQLFVQSNQRIPHSPNMNALTLFTRNLKDFDPIRDTRHVREPIDLLLLS